MEGRLRAFANVKRATIAVSFENSTLRCALLALIAFVVHLPALHGPRIWDDETLIGRNPLIRSPIAEVQRLPMRAAAGD